jgi:SAM-dependent methyltransferase
MTDADLKHEIREHYGRIAREAGSCCTSDCGCGDADTALLAPGREEYDSEIVNAADLGLSCGDPTRFAGLAPGMKVLDLGAGAGIDVFLASRQVGPHGEAIGLDMTDAMLQRARMNAEKLGIRNARFVKGEIEDIPLPADSVDHVLSNCVINLVPDKRRAFGEIHRVLREGGSFTISDIVIEGRIPEELRNDPKLWSGCISGAEEKSTYLELIRSAGFGDVEVVAEKGPEIPDDRGFRILSVTVRGRKAKK